MNTTTNTTTTTTHRDFTFGIEIETTGISQEAAARAIAAELGCTSYYNVATLADGRSWKCVRDGSVSGLVNAEVVSPICTFADIDMVQRVVRALRAAGAKCDSSTGIHVHVGVKHLPVRALVNLVRLVARFEDIVGRSVEVLDARRRWCRPVNVALLASLDRRMPKTIDELKTVWYTAHEDEGSRGAETAECTHYDASRYHGLNLHSYWYANRGTAEFRFFNGTLHAGKVRGYIMLCLAMVARAANSKSISRRPFTFNAAAAKHQMSGFMRDCRMVGEEFDSPRKHLLETLPGTSNSYAAARAMGTSRTSPVVAPVAEPVVDVFAQFDAVNAA